MTRFQWKISPPTKNQEDLNLNKKRWSTGDTHTRIICQGAKGSHNKNPSTRNYKHTWKKFFLKKSQQRNSTYEVKTNGNFETEKYNN